MAARSVQAGAPADRRLALLAGVSPGVVVLAAAIPLLFLHVSFQPGVTVSVGGSSATAYLSDFAVLAVVLAALARLRAEAGALRAGLPVWVAGAALFAWIAVEVVHGHARASGYSLATHGISAAKFFEYGLLAPALVLLVRRRVDLLAVLWSLTLWSCAATVVGLLQFAGVAVADPAPSPGHRQASFLSSSDFAALSAGVLLVGIAAATLPRLGLGRRLAGVALATGVLGTIVAGSMASVIGVATALAVLAIVLAVRRELPPARLAAAGAVALVVLGGTVAIRGSDLEAFGRFLGGSPPVRSTRGRVESYAHRTLLSWMGLRMWRDHPVLGLGWEASADPAGFTPYLPALHARFPAEPANAFPAAAPGRHYGVQDAWIEALADLGVVGFILWTAAFATAAWTALRGVLRGRGPAPLLALLALGLLLWLWTAQGFYAGIPLDALTALVFGLATLRTVEP